MCQQGQSIYMNLIPIYTIHQACAKPWSGWVESTSYLFFVTFNFYLSPQLFCIVLYIGITISKHIFCCISSHLGVTLQKWRQYMFIVDEFIFIKLLTLAGMGGFQAPLRFSLRVFKNSAHYLFAFYLVFLKFCQECNNSTFMSV